MDTLVIRQYQYSDKKEIFNLHVRALKNENAYMYTHLTPVCNPKGQQSGLEGYMLEQSRVVSVYTGEWEKDFDDIKGIYLNNRGEFIVGTLNNKIIAMGALRKMTEDIVELRRMRIDPAFQRRGFWTDDS